MRFHWGKSFGAPWGRDSLGNPAPPPFPWPLSAPKKAASEQTALKPFGIKKFSTELERELINTQWQEEMKKSYQAALQYQPTATELKARYAQMQNMAARDNNPGGYCVPCGAPCVYSHLDMLFHCTQCGSTYDRL